MSAGVHEGGRDLAVTFAGGGNRAFYQFGLLRAWADRLLPRVRAFAACSAGAAVAAMWLSQRRDAAREVWFRRTEGLQRNFEWRKCLRGERIAPHGEIFREILLALAGDGGLERVRATPFPVLVVATGFPDVLTPGMAVAAGICAYQVGRSFRPGQLHPTLGRQLGFRPVVFDMRECESPEEFADLILASSATPPFTPVGRFRGRMLLDGGMVDNAPAFVGDAVPGVRRNLVLLTRPYPPSVRLGQHGTRYYLAPSAPPPLERWDYTKPHLLQANIDLGEADAETYWPELERFLEWQHGAE